MSSSCSPRHRCNVSVDEIHSNGNNPKREDEIHCNNMSSSSGARHRYHFSGWHFFRICSCALFWLCRYDSLVNLRNSVYCSVLQCVAVCCSVLQCVAVCCSVLQCVAVCCSVLQCDAVYCSVLQCVAVCCTISLGLVLLGALNRSKCIAKKKKTFFASTTCCAFARRGCKFFFASTTCKL